MRKLKSIASEFYSKYEDYRESANPYVTGFEKGFKEAFNIIKLQIDEEKAVLDQYPMMSERKAAMTRMQQKLEDILNKVIE